MNGFLPAELSGALLVAARILPSGLVVSLASRGGVPLWLGLGLALAIAAGLLGDVPAPQALDHARLLSALPRELCLGLVFASAVATPFFALGAGVRFVAGRNEPASLSPPLRTLYLLSALALTLSLGGLRAYARALSDSLRSLPIAAAALNREQLLAETQTIVTQALAAALALGLPLLSALWLLDLTLALVQRVVHATGKVELSPLRRGCLLLLLALLCAPLVSRMPELVRAALAGGRATALRLSR